MSQEITWQVQSFNELSNSKLYEILLMRQQVFVVEQNCPFPDLDNMDQQAMHMQAYGQGKLLAYQRCLEPGLAFTESSLGRIAVAAEARGLNLGRELVQRGIDYNLSAWPHSDIQIGAQSYLTEFYQSFDFVQSGAEYIEDGILHIHMIRTRAER